MKLQTLALTAIAALGMTAPAFAGGTSLYNEHSVRRTSGDTTVKVRGLSTVDGVKTVRGLNVKLDAVGQNAGTSLTYYNGNVSASGFANNIDNPDPFVNFGEVKTFDRATYSDVTRTSVDENSTFTERTERYELGSSY